MRRPPDTTGSTPAPPPPGPWTFRRMVLDDLERIMAIEKDGFAHPWSAELIHREMLHDWSTILLATETRAGTAAMLCLLRAHETVFMFKMAFDESMRRYSPGTQLVADLYAWFQANPTIAVIDTCAAPDDRFANRLFPDRRALGAFMIAGDRVGALTSLVAPRLVAWTKATRSRTWRHAARSKQ